jgi:hypothetical protein
MGGNRILLLVAVAAAQTSVAGAATESAQEKGKILTDLGQEPLSMAQLVEMIEQLQQDERLFFAESFRFVWWVRGGEPGSGSDLVEVSGDGKRLQGMYIRARFQPGQHPPMLSEQFVAPLTPPQASSILKPVLASPLYRSRLDAEKKPAWADLLKENWELRKGRVDVKKTLYEPFPDSLAPARTALRALSEYLAKNGKRSVLAPKPIKS